MLPNALDEWINFRPIDRHDSQVVDFQDMFKILTIEEATSVLNSILLDTNSTFFEFYSRYISVDSSSQSSEVLLDLSEIYDDYQNPFWGLKYPEIQKRYLRISSIEGEYSYFYDKQTDSVYGVDWSEMDDFMEEKLETLFKSFYDFLEWYYSE